MESTEVFAVDWGALNWSAVAFVFIFVATQLINLVVRQVQRRDERKNLAKALLAEITALHAGVLRQDPEKYLAIAEDVLNNAPDRVTVYSASFVYKSNVDNLGLFPNDLVQKIVRMYTLSSILDQMLLDLRSERMERMPADYADKMKRDILGYLKEVQSLVQSTVPQLERHVA